VLVAPALLLAVSAVIQAMLYYHAVQVARLAATQGLVATQGLSGSTSAGRDRATAVLDQIGGVNQPTITAQRTGDMAQVHISGHIAMLIPGLRLTVHGDASGPIARYQP
jgi:hypothetical protein